MIEARQILRKLDADARKFAFPGFDNMNYDHVDARLHAYVAKNMWALVIESLVDWPGAGGLMTSASCHGDGVVKAGLTARTAVLFEQPEESDPDGASYVPAEVVVRGETIAVDVAAVRAIEGAAGRLALALWLIAQGRRDALFRSEEELVTLVKPGMRRVLTLEEWAHPDVYGEQKPSLSPAFLALAEVLASGDATRYRAIEPPNSRDWRRWAK